MVIFFEVFVLIKIIEVRNFAKLYDLIFVRDNNSVDLESPICFDTELREALNSI